MKPAIANSLWLAGCVPALARFHRATKRVAATQEAILRAILSANSGTEFGRAHGFGSICSSREYQQRVPLRNYEDCAAEIQRMAAGEHNVLISDAVQRFEPTSGSSSAEKWIPYTRALQREFQAGINAWIADLFLHDPELLSGQDYWSVSPVAAGERKTTAGISIGFDEDAAYLGGWQRRVVTSLMAVPSAVRMISDMETFRYVTLLFLVRSRMLKLISVWNPTFLSLLVAPLREWGDLLAHDLERGTITTRVAISQSLVRAFGPDPRRAGELRAALRAGSPAATHAQLWPALRLLSCWTDANSFAAARNLAALFPQTRMQGKGLLATEGFVSFPLQAHEGSALAICSHFLEFLPVNEAGNCDAEHPRFAHELENGQKYSVVLTTGGGLYRFQLQDLIEVAGRVNDCPLIRFLGRQNYVSDWFGEKLNEAHIFGIFRDVFGELDQFPTFAMLACDTDPPAPGYVLYIESSATEITLHRAAANIEERLCENFHYNYARQLGQLASLRVFRASGAAETFVEAKRQSGQRAGAIKQMALDQRTGWSRVFHGEFIAKVTHEAVAQWSRSPRRSTASRFSSAAEVDCNHRW
jgi:GH3 auxin-responsive promoter